MKVMLDECITMKCANLVIQFIKLGNPRIEAFFLVDYLGKQGVQDSQWASQLKPPADWLVISADCGTHGPKIHAKGPPLHLILPSLGITGVFLAGKKLSQTTGSERAKALIAKSTDIIATAAACKHGTRFKLKYSGTGLILEEWPLSRGISPTASPPPS
jgi:hypothetical protein